MKKISLILFFHCLILTIISGQDFITKWKIDTSGAAITFNALTKGPVNYSWSAMPSGKKGSGSFNVLDNEVVESIFTSGNVSLTDIQVKAGEVVTIY
jgi:hypothetical protein